ncbi:EthD family reductase [Rhizosphaericola mali]|uniref:EthD family reductase n=1 Tax=Rhizosphaericola mali TaxID=2545455 RepID=A0A5P2FXR8_9BACT|nr:EthD family reductase [Rhizosphaericola mali]QES87188.1 EthD family reductase [Rhizosphaericola mali]
MHNELFTVYVTYQETENSHFDRDYYTTTHVPLVIHTWQPYGLIHAAAFYPKKNTSGTIVICECVFKNKEAFEKAFAAPETDIVMNDVKQFTNLTPRRLFIHA